MLPEPCGWDHAPFDGGHDAVLLHVARALAEHWWIERLRPARARGHAVLGLDARAYELGAGGWRDLDVALDPIELAILDRGGKELARVTGRAAGGRITAEVAAAPAEVVLDPERHLLDRKPHDNRRPVVLVSGQAAQRGDAR